MVFQLSGFRRVEPSGNGPYGHRVSLYEYRSDEAWTTISANSNYFSDMYEVLIPNDRIRIYGNIQDDGASGDGGVVRITSISLATKTVTHDVVDIDKDV